MPIYEYVCPSCELKFEQLRRMSQVDEKAACPRCGKSSKRVLSVFCSVSKDSGGMTVPIGGGPSCGSCGGGSCSTCGA